MRQPVSFRFDEPTKELLDALAGQIGVSRLDVLRMALRLLAKREGVGVNGATAKNKRK
jgi:antitoxin component of RelBE/YafQ-DinJ toxin-antitoxin module